MKSSRSKYQRILFGAAAGLSGGYLVGTYPAWLLLALPVGIVFMQHKMMRQVESVMAMGRLGCYLQTIVFLAILAALGFMALRDAGLSLMDLGLVNGDSAKEIGFGVLLGLIAALVAHATYDVFAGLLLGPKGTKPEVASG